VLPEIVNPTAAELLTGFSRPVRFGGVDWDSVPARPGVYVIFDGEECLYVGMAGRNGKGTLRGRLRKHASGELVQMFAQYLFLARVQFQAEKRITHPRAANAACRAYIRERCSFRYLAVSTATEARSLEARLKKALAPAFNGVGDE
jgi:excinuclease UvrABC nuclease subunit